MSNFYTSDNHFGHRAILNFDPLRRKDNGFKFNDIREHDEYLIAKWNEVVGPNDTAYHLGDMFYKCSKNYAESIWWRLNGSIILIPGNHDYKITLSLDVPWLKVQHVLRVRVKKPNGVDQDILLSHRPFLSWERSCWHLHGHCHSKINDQNIKVMREDCGVDNNNLSPFTEEQIIKKFLEK